MNTPTRSPPSRHPRATFFLLTALIVLLCLAGGASRADVAGTVVTRAGTWAIVLVAIWVARRPSWDVVGPLAIYLAVVVGVLLLQLTPLPPAVWLRLPGRELLAQAAIVSGQPQPWRPLSISPVATFNALLSLSAPLAVLWLMGAVDEADRRRIGVVVLAVIGLSAAVAAMQFSGVRFDNPLVNEPPGEVSGLFANRNHFALLMAIGCLMAPVLAFGNTTRQGWIGLGALAAVLILVMITLASGSRAGSLLAIMGAGIGLLIARAPVAARLRTLPRKQAIAMVVVPVVLFVSVIALTVFAGRAISLERMLFSASVQDPRMQFVPIVIHEIGRYWPAGTGYGTFDPVFRITEPEWMLSTSYLNHAHSDFVEVVLDGGVVGVALLVWAFGWFAWKSFAAWRPSRAKDRTMAKLGSGIVLLVSLASITDYPARTPMIMAVLVVACIWLNSGEGKGSHPRHIAG